MKKASVVHKKHKKKIHRISHWARKWFLKSGCDFKVMAELILGSAVVMATFVFGFYYQQEFLIVVPQGVVFQGQDVSGLHRAEAEVVASEAARDLASQTIEMGIEENLPEAMHGSEGAGDTTTFTTEDLGVGVDVGQTVSEFFQVADRFGRADVISGSDVNQKVIVLPTVAISDLSRALTWVGQHERAPQDATLVLEDGQWKLIPDVDGLHFSDERRSALEGQLKDQFLVSVSPKRLPIVLDRVEAKVKVADLQPLYDQIQPLFAPHVSWTIDGYVSTFSLAEHQDMIQADIEKKTVQLDEHKLRQFVADLAATADRVTKNVSVPEPAAQDQGYLKAEYQGSFDHGRVLDQEAFFAALSGALQTGAEKTTLTPIFSETVPTVTMTGVGDLTLLSQGKSSFKLGNIPDRMFNVKKGLSKYDGVVIPAGAEFSFDQELGPVTYEAGWKPALAIFGGGGVSMSPGGGLCQVSTTMYRAAVLSGLPVTKRKAHSLDVSYYHEYGYGIDATVYPPIGLDLKFVNDTPGPILIHTYTIDSQTDAFVEFYGLNDGRSVELTPKSNFHPAAGGRYISWNWDITNSDGAVDHRVIQTYYVGTH